MNKRNSFKNVRNSNLRWVTRKSDSELLKITKEWIPEYREKLFKNSPTVVTVGNTISLKMQNTKKDSILLKSVFSLMQGMVTTMNMLR